MILNNITTEEAIILSDNDKKEMNISSSPEVQAHIIKVLTDYSYKNKIESIIREAVSNSIDSNIQAGKQGEAVYVRLKKYQDGKWYFQSEDQGLGLDRKEFDKYIMGIGESTKREDSRTFGYYGGGAKAPLCKVNSFEWICRKNGVERKFNIFKTSTIPSREMIYEQPTDKPNGCIVHIDIPLYDSIVKWKEALKEQLAYLPNIVFDIDEETEDWNNFSIFQHEDFEIRRLTKDKHLHISLGGIYYPIDWQSMGKNSWFNIDTPIALRFKLTDGLQPTFSRESLQYNEKTKNLIDAKIKKVAEYFKEQYDKKVQEFSTFLEAYDFINNDSKNITIGDFTIDITDFMDYSELKLSQVKVKNLKFSPYEYKKRFDYFFEGYYSSCELGAINQWVRSRFIDRISYAINQKRKVVLLSESPTGYFKTWLKETYLFFTLFVAKHKKNPFTLKKYKKILDLHEIPKKEWRERIVEWQKVENELIEAMFEDGTSLKDSLEFKTWFLAQKEKEKQKRIYNGKSINKEKGDITVGWLRKANYKNSLVAVKKAEKINSLKNLFKMCVYGTFEEMKKEEKFIVGWLEYISNNKIYFLSLNATEIKHVRNFKNFKTIHQFMESKPLSRVITSILIKKELNKLSSDHREMIKIAFPSYEKTIDSLVEYNRINREGLSSAFEETLLNMLVNNPNLIDGNISNELAFIQKINKDFSFLKYMKSPMTYDQENTRIIKSLIYVFLKERKINNKILENYELVEIPQDETVNK